MKMRRQTPASHVTMEDIELLETTFRIDVVAPVKDATTFRRARRTKSSVTGSTLSFHGLSFHVDAPATDTQRCNCCRTVAKQILHDVRWVHISACSKPAIEPGCLLAVFVDDVSAVNLAE